MGNKNVTGNQYLQEISKVCDKYPVSFNKKNKGIHSCKYKLKIKINTRFKIQKTLFVIKAYHIVYKLYILTVDPTKEPIIAPLL